MLHPCPLRKGFTCGGVCVCALPWLRERPLNASRGVSGRHTGYVQGTDRLQGGSGTVFFGGVVGEVLRGPVLRFSPRSPSKQPRSMATLLSKAGRNVLAQTYAAALSKVGWAIALCQPPPIPYGTALQSLLCAISLCCVTCECVFVCASFCAYLRVCMCTCCLCVCVCGFVHVFLECVSE